MSNPTAGKGFISAMSILLGADTGEFEKAMQNAERTLARTGKKLERLGKDLTMSVSAPLAAIGAVSVNAFANFDDAMTKSTAIMGNLTDELRNGMEKAAMDVAKTTTVSASQAAEAFYFLASAGLDANQAIAALPQVAKFAQAGAFDMARATELVSDAQSALGLKSADAAQNLENLTRVTDVLVKGNILANASVEQLSASLTNKAAASIRALGKDMEEGVAVLAAFADQGIKGDRAGEGLSIMLRDLQKAAATNAGEFKRLGITVFDSSGNMRNVADIVKDLEGALAGMSNEQRQATFAALGFTDGSVAYINALVGMSDKIRTYEAELRKAGGTTEEVAERQLKSFSAQMSLVRNNLELAGISIGKILAPAIGALARMVSGITDRFNAMSDAGKGIAVTLGVIAAGVGPVIIGLGLLIQNVKTLATAFGVLKLAMVNHPIIAIAAILTTVAAAVYLTADGVGALTDKLRAQLGISQTLNGSQEERNKILAKMVEVGKELEKQQALLAQQGMDPAFSDADAINRKITALNKELDALRLLADQNLQVKNRTSEMTAEVERMTAELEQALGPTSTLVREFVKLGDAQRRLVSMPAGALKSSGSPTLSLAPDTRSLEGLDRYLAMYDKKILSATSDTERRSLAIKRQGFADLRAEMEKSVADATKTTTDFANQFNMTIAPMLASALGGIAGAFVEMSTAALLSGGSMGGVFTGILGALADLSVQVGKMAIGIGLAIEGIKASLLSLNPVVAVAAGAALVALGTAAKIGLANAARSKSEGKKIPALADGGIAVGRSLVEVGEYPGANVNPEVIMPLNKLQNLLGGMATGASQVLMPSVVAVEIQGDKLVAFIEMKSDKMKRTTGRGIRI